MRHYAHLVLLLCATGAAPLLAAQDMGRLFTTPAERATLERLRVGGKAPAGPAGAASAAATAPEAVLPAPLEGEHVIEVNGTVRRSGSGRATTWVDSVAHNDNDQIEGGIVLARGAGTGNVVLTLASGKRVSAKAGQNVDAVSGKVLEGYQSGIVRTR